MLVTCPVLRLLLPFACHLKEGRQNLEGRRVIVRRDEGVVREDVAGQATDVIEHALSASWYLSRSSVNVTAHLHIALLCHASSDNL